MALNSSINASDNGSDESVSNTEIKSPDYLGHKPKNNKDVIRIGRKPIICVAISLSVVAAVMTYTLVVKSIAAQHYGDDDLGRSDLSTNIAFLDKKPKTGLIGEEKPVATNKPALDTSRVKELQVPSPAPNSATAANPYDQAEFQLWQQREQEKLQLEQAKLAELKNALNAETVSYKNNQAEENRQPQLYGAVKQEQQMDYSHPQRSSVSIPSEKTDAGGYLLHTRVQAASQFELKAGTVIPSVILGGINSDLPGQIMAQVSQNVYDSAAGKYLLIPQGAKLVGNYDHQVMQGAHRVLVVWHRLIYPDASEVNIENMNGADQSGYAGFKDKTDGHFWPTFRNALMLSAITAGAQLSQPQAQTGSTISSQQILAAAMGMQMNNLGMSTISRNLNQPPTIEIRPGYVFNVMINKDMILAPWQPGATPSEEGAE
jgi:type IV secretory pathway VirB10-like protein